MNILNAAARILKELCDNKQIRLINHLDQVYCK